MSRAYVTKLERAHERLRVARAMISTVIVADTSGDDDTTTVLAEAGQIIDEVTRYLAKRRQRQLQRAGHDEATAQKAVGQ